jgi:hypothetical protein
MGGRARLAPAVLLLAALIAAPGAGCGGGDGGEDSTGQASTAAQTTAASAVEAKQGDESRSKSFISNGDDNVPLFGTEASDEERQEISQALTAYMNARAEGDWKTACRYTSPRQKAVLEFAASKRKDLKGKKCPGIVSALAAPSSARVNTMTGPVDSARQEGGTRAFALYHGKGGVDYYMPMLSHYGDWEVAALAPTPIP